jgi:hypothetical protein
MNYFQQPRFRIGMLLPAAVFALGAFVKNEASAIERVYTIVPSESTIAISGSVMTDVGTAQIQTQGAGSLTTNYSGTIRTERTNDTIQFLPGSSIDAAVSGNWQPLSTGAAGSAEADYGGRVSLLLGFVTINFAARDFVGDLSSDALPVDRLGNFSLASATVRFLNGNLAYRVSTGDAGGESVAGLSGMTSGMGSVTTGAGTGGLIETLSIPINSSFTIPVEDSTTVNLELMGELVATAMLQSGQPGDFNQDGRVDAADYVVWRNELGTTYQQSDYQVWRAHFGETTATAEMLPTSKIIGAAVPEPAAWIVLAAILLAVALSRKRLSVEM